MPKVQALTMTASPTTMKPPATVVLATAHQGRDRSHGYPRLQSDEISICILTSILGNTKQLVE